ncbi:hypothetical protein [Levilactobacillus mulengensis]|uniref:hypothetical protein n=1 Tax=Levilactobacillus mulengensis TaxID=2486025 RepID=UPI0013DDCD73|nr:hypothetical protein [Levilactobacillus mulengensis]
MDMKKIVMAATLLSIVTGGEVSALAAKTQHSVAKITHVKVTKHKVTGYTTAQSHVKLMKLKHGEKVSATANKHGKFTLKVKSNNLTKLKFKLKATKTGLKARTYTHKVKKAVQSIDDGATTETQTAPAVVKPDSSSADKQTEKKKETHKEAPKIINVYSTPKTEFESAQLAFDNAIGLAAADKTAQKDMRARMFTLINDQITPSHPNPTAATDFSENVSDHTYNTFKEKIKTSKNYSAILSAAKRLIKAKAAITALNSLTEGLQVPNPEVHPQ